MVSRNQIAAAVLAAVCCATAAFADEFHYNNILIGDRASGMGGAYTAVSDDPSGMFYNPAGIAYSTGKNLSASVNAYNVTDRTYKGVIGGQEWKRKSSTLLPNFFGIVQPVGKLKLGFSYAVPDSNQEDQDQTFSYNNPAWATDVTHVINFNNKNDTNLFGPSIAAQLTDNFSVGATLYVHKRSTEAILNQSVEAVDKSKYYWANAYLETDEWGLRPVVGIMWSPAEKLSLGAAVSRTFVLSSEVLSQSTVSTNDPTLAVITPFDRSNSGLVTSSEKRRYPYQVSAGVAYFPSPSLLLTADLNYFTAYDYTFVSIANKREAVLNGALGMEYYFTKDWAVRTGFFTDFASTPDLQGGEANQKEHIDYYGGSLTVSHFTRNTSITAGGSYKYGSGKAQILGGATALQDATASSWTLFVSSSYAY